MKWIAVRKDAPCPACGKPDWCSILSNGKIVRCMRNSEGAYQSKQDKSGTTFYLHRTSAELQPDLYSTEVRVGTIERANVETLHAVYSAFLNQLKLIDSHRDNLRCRGLSEEQIEYRGYRSHPGQQRARIARIMQEQFGEVLHQVPGFIQKKGNDGCYLTLAGTAGILIPCRDSQGRVIALKIRRDAEGDGSRYFYFSSASYAGPGPGSPIHFPLGDDTESDVVRITEGELKADVVQAHTAILTLSLPGVTNWQKMYEVLEPLTQKRVRLAFDMDAWENPIVARALYECAHELADRDYEVELEQWDAQQGKGLDDLLASGQQPVTLTTEVASEKIAEIFASATADEDPEEPCALNRLYDVVQNEGAEGLFRDEELLQAIAEVAQFNPIRYAEICASLGKRISRRDLDRVVRNLPAQSVASPEASLQF